MSLKIFNSGQIKEIDSYTIENEPVKSISLMERAAGKCTGWIVEKYDNQCVFSIFIGPGNNGGDGLAIARQLAEKKYQVFVYLVKISEQLAEDAQANLEKLQNNKKASIQTIQNKEEIPRISAEQVIVDALFGTGLSRPVEGVAGEVIQKINKSEATVISIDIPSGLMSEDNSGNNFDNIIKASHTLSFQFPKLAFFFSDNAQYVGNWHILPIGLHPRVIQDMASRHLFLTRPDFEKMIMVRKKFSHKGTFGHALLIAGSYGKMGAAVLGSRACLRTGAGLCTVHIPRVGYEIMQTTVPEAMVSVDDSKKAFSYLLHLNRYTAIGIGPGIGTRKKTKKGLAELLYNIERPVVIDADAINILGEKKELLAKIPPESILTPHPKEFARIAGKSSNKYDQLKKLIEFACNYSVYVVLKGAYTRVACPDGICYFNSTGNPGMATAGSGDVLTGIILSLLAQDYPPRKAALLGVYLHGLAGDLATANDAPESVIAGDIIQNIGNAFNVIKEKMYE